MTTTLNGITIADPISELPIARRLIGSQTDALNGTNLLDYTAEVAVWSLEWGLLTATERNTIMAIIDNEALHTMSFSPPHTSTSYTITIKRDTILETVRGLSDTRYSIRFDVEVIL